VDVDVDGDALPELLFAVGPGGYAPGFLRMDRVREMAVTPGAPLRVENPVHGVAFVDSNADGVKEVVIGAHDVTVLSASVVEADSHFDVGGWVRALAAGDFTGDGLADLAALNEQREVFLLVGQGGGRFERRATPLATLPPGKEPLLPWGARMQAGDFNRDGREDLLVTSHSLGVTLLTSSDRGFTLSKPFGDSRASGSVGDLDRDGWLDVVLGGVSYLGRPGGSFTPVWKEAGERPIGVLRDLDADGLLDLVSTGGFYLGQGNGHFGWRAEDFPSHGLFVAAGDWNGDGRTDLLSAANHGMGEGFSQALFQGQDHRFTRTSARLSGDALADAWSTDLEGDAKDELLITTAHTYEPHAYWRLELYRLPREL
jgi:hypothetical protein